MGESGRCVKSLQHIQRFSEGFRSKCEHDVSCSLSQFEPDGTRRCHLGIRPCHQGRKTCSFSTFRSSADLILGHFSWLASLISVLSLGYTAVQSRTLQFSSHCVWKYSYSTVKHIRELYCWVLTFSFHQTFQWTLTDHPRFLSWTYFLLKDECSPRSLQV